MADTKNRAYHVGRVGEVAGGMTQVLNAYLSWPFEHFEISVITSRNGSLGLKGMGIFIGACWRTLRIPRGPGRVLVVVHLSQGGSFIREGLILILARARGFATVAQLHGSSFVAFSRRHPRLVRVVLGRADLVHVLSAESAKAARAMADPGDVVLIPNAVAPGNPGPKTNTVVFGGAVTKRKGVDVLMSAWRAVPNRVGWTLKIAGPLAEPELAEHASSDVEVLGAVPHTQLMSLLDRSKIAVLPSLDEAMPMFILEALARQNCVLSTSVGAIPSLLGDDRGIVVPPADTEALATQLAGVINDESRRDRVAALGRAYFDTNFSTETVLPRLERAWLRAIEHRAASGHR